MTETAIDPDYMRMMRPILETLRLRKPREIDEGALRDILARADRAERLMEDPDLRAAFDAVEAVFMHVWKTSGFEEVQKRERAHISINLLKDIKTYLRTAVEQGDAAARELQKVVR